MCDQIYFDLFGTQQMGGDLARYVIELPIQKQYFPIFNQDFCNIRLDFPFN